MKNRWKYRIHKTIIALCLLPASTHASRVENPIFGYPHLLPSPFTMRAGRLALGTDAAFGVTDFLQVGTNIVSDVYSVWNANAKVSLIDYPEFAAGVTLGYETYNYRDFDSANPDLRVSTWLPGVTTAFALGHPDLALFMGGSFRYASSELHTGDVVTSGYAHGASVGSDVAWAYNPRKGNGVGNALSGGVSYDFSYRIFGFGVSHHWPGFHFGLHYYPNASKYRVQPIITGGMALDL